MNREIRLIVTALLSPGDRKVSGAQSYQTYV